MLTLPALLSGLAAAALLAPGPAERGPTRQEFKALRIELVEARYVGPGTIEARLRYERKQKNPLVLGLMAPSTDCWIVDGSNERYRFVRVSGVDRVIGSANQLNDVAVADLAGRQDAELSFLFRSRHRLEPPSGRVRMSCRHVFIDPASGKPTRDYKLLQLRDIPVRKDRAEPSLLNSPYSSPVSSAYTE